jgi:myo-inositol-1(or 4)-monophosphatase
MHPMLNIAVQAARQAGRVITRSLDRLDAIEVNSKSRNDFVTQIDQQSEAEIIDIIHKSYPDHAILAEESGAQAGKDDFTWIIDPLDGTTNFIHGFPQFAISIALQHRQKIEVAVVYDPLRQELFTAARGRGAQLNNRKIRVSTSTQLSNALLGTGFPFKQFTH